MQIIVHRGTHQIGGCATEIRTEKTRVFIDFGAELNPGSSNELSVDGVTKSKTDCDGILFTHYHGDHIGLLNSINNDIPLYSGELSKQIMILLNERQKIYDNNRLKNINIFKAGIPLDIGDIKVTPFMVDHSAFDAYMFLIEADGKRLLHTGDFRTHGFRGKGLFKVIDRHIGNVDILICEGTTISRSDENAKTERELSVDAVKLFIENKYVFVVCASTNIDRIAAFYSAVPTGKYCLCDSYQKDVLDAVETESGRHSKLYRFNKMLTYGENLNEKLQNRGFCMFVRLGNQHHRTIIEKFRKFDPLVVYSMWSGYLNDKKTSDFLQDFRMTKLHTSGHADKETIKQLIIKLNPEVIIPIHTESPPEMIKLAEGRKVLTPLDKEIISL